MKRFDGVIADSTTNLAVRWEDAAGNLIAQAHLGQQVRRGELVSIWTARRQA